jgi:hypothetical protein
VTEFYFERNTGDVTLGAGAAAVRYSVMNANTFHEMVTTADKLKEAGVATSVRPSTLPEEIAPLHSLILNPADSGVKPGDYTRNGPRNWDEDTWIAFGGWLIRVLHKDTDFHRKPQIYYNYIDQCQTLGLSPGFNRILPKWGNIANYRRTLGLPEGKITGQYDNWSLADFTHYANRISRRLRERPNHSGRPLRADYALWARQGRGPGEYTIQERIGGIRNLNEMIGYPDIYAWEDEDYFDWGVRAMDANPGLSLSRYVLRILSRRDRGPSVPHITERFGMRAFQQKVVQRRALRDGDIADTETKWSALYDKLVAQGRVTADRVEDRSKTNRNQKVTIAMRYEAARQCIPTAKKETLDSLARSALGLATDIHNRTEGDVEMIAVSLHIFDYLWPAEQTSTLHITAEELAAEKRQDHARYPRRSKA